MEMKQKLIRRELFNKNTYSQFLVPTFPDLLEVRPFHRSKRLRPVVAGFSEEQIPFQWPINTNSTYSHRYCHWSVHQKLFRTETHTTILKLAKNLLLC